MRALPRAWTRAFAAVALSAIPASAPAQAPLAVPTFTSETAPAAECAACPTHGRKDCGACGLRQYPRSEKHYIKQFCKPTISPGSCFGHFKPQITRWSDACPNWAAGREVVHPGAAAYHPQAPTTPAGTRMPTDSELLPAEGSGTARDPGTAIPQRVSAPVGKY